MTERGDALLEWYDAHRRDLPWRRTDDPYLILVSEVMLQQTQAERVVPFFEGFIERYPTVEDLAAAPLADLLRLWKGLGYPSRARRLREAAKVIAADGWPDDLATLPGVGPYTAAAVGAFAFGRDEIAVDTNVKRVVSRWMGRPFSGTELAAHAAEVREGPASAWNQAMMELGALVCRRRSPKCDTCPVEKWCADPTVYSPPPRQARFAGSKRQERGRILTELLERPVEIGDLAGSSAMPDRVPAIVADLERDGLVATDGDAVRLAD